jgi:hypothetical protein
MNILRRHATPRHATPRHATPREPYASVLTPASLYVKQLYTTYASVCKLINTGSFNMNIPILLASLLSFLTLGAHIFGGQPEIMMPVLDSELSNYLKAILMVLWHLTTTVLIINSLALIFASLKNTHRLTIVSLTSIQYLFWAALFIFYGIKNLGTLWPMPQWIAFILIPTLALWGLKQNKKT